LSYRIRVSPRGRRQIEKAADWWFENRGGSLLLFSEEIERAFVFLQVFPKAGEPVRHHRIPNVRRILLSPVHYHLYYIVSEEEKTVEILELWHTSRDQPTR
jgi:plasmid stabilization system protein ParE